MKKTLLIAILIALILMVGCTTTPLKYRVSHYSPHYYGYYNPSYYNQFYRNYRIERARRIYHHHHYHPRPIKFRHYIDPRIDRIHKNKG